MYDYYSAVAEDVEDYVRANIDFADYDTIDELEEHLNDVLWTEDSVTGNGSGSYTFDRNKAKEYVLENTDAVAMMADAFDVADADIGEHFRNNDWEWFDVCIRCYYLGQAIDYVLDEYYEEFQDAHK